MLDRGKNSESEKESLWVLLHHKALVVISKASPPAFICERRGSEQQSETHEAICGFWSAEYLMRNVNEPIQHSVRMSCILSVDWFYLFFFFLSWTTECFCFSCWWQILLVFPPPVRMARLCIEKDAAENLNTKQEVLRFQHFASFADSLTMNRSVSALTAFTDSLLRKGLRSLRGRESEKGGGGENLKEMLLIHSETVNSQPDPTLPKLSLDLTPLISFFHTRSSVGLPLPLRFLFSATAEKVDLLYFASISPFTCPLFPPFPFLSWARLKPGGKAHWCFCRPPSPYLLFSQPHRGRSVHSQVVNAFPQLVYECWLWPCLACFPLHRYPFWCCIVTISDIYCSVCILWMHGPL